MNKTKNKVNAMPNGLRNYHSDKKLNNIEQNVKKKVNSHCYA